MYVSSGIPANNKNRPNVYSSMALYRAGVLAIVPTLGLFCCLSNAIHIKTHKCDIGSYNLHQQFSNWAASLLITEKLLDLTG